MTTSALRARWRWLWEATASEIAEAAVILPLLFTLLFGIYWFGRAFSIYGTINHAARQAVLTAATPSCASCPGGGFPPDTTVADVVSQALTAANLDPSKVQPSPNPLPTLFCPNVPSGCDSPSTPGNFTICRNVVLNPKSPQPQQACGMIVSFQYPYQFVLPFTSLNRQLVNLRAQAEAVGEN